ncbi:MAG: DUF6176 family protein [Anaerolineae bacterium]
MSDVLCSRIKLKPGSLPRVREWARVMKERRDEALATLEAEGVYEEIVFLDSSEAGDYLIIFMRAEDMARAQELGRTSEASIDQYHKEFKRDVIESGRGLELLVDLERLGGL